MGPGRVHVSRIPSASHTVFASVRCNAAATGTTNRWRSSAFQGRASMLAGLLYSSSAPGAWLRALSAPRRRTQDARTTVEGRLSVRRPLGVSLPRFPCPALITASNRDIYTRRRARVESLMSPRALCPTQTLFSRRAGAFKVPTPQAPLPSAEGRGSADFLAAVQLCNASGGSPTWLGRQRPGGQTVAVCLPVTNLAEREASSTKHPRIGSRSSAHYAGPVFVFVFRARARGLRRPSLRQMIHVRTSVSYPTTPCPRTPFRQLAPWRFGRRQDGTLPLIVDAAGLFPSLSLLDADSLLAARRTRVELLSGSWIADRVTPNIIHHSAPSAWRSEFSAPLPSFVSDHPWQHS